METSRMSESFVDVTYHGLSLARRVKLVQVRPTMGYLEVPQPMPVGTAVAIITDDTVALDAIVVAIHEQVAGTESPPGMLVRPKLDGDAARAWWKARVSLPELEPERPRARTAESMPMVVIHKRVTNPGMGVPQIVDDGHDTGVMDAVDPAMLEAAAASRELPKLVDDGKKTIAMQAVDLAALGLDPNANDDGDDSDDENKPEGKPGARKRRKRR